MITAHARPFLGSLEKASFSLRAGRTRPDEAPAVAGRQRTGVRVLRARPDRQENTRRAGGGVCGFGKAFAFLFRGTNLEHSRTGGTGAKKGPPRDQASLPRQMAGIIN